MKNFIYASIFVSAFVFLGCSTKEVYTPQDTAGEWEQQSSMKAKIIDKGSDVALLENAQVLTKDTLLDLNITEEERVLGVSDGWIISATIDGNLTLTALQDFNNTKHFDLKDTVATASVSGDTMAVLFANNDMALYDINTQELLFKEQGGKASVVDIRIVAPQFMGDLVIFATLDGKVVIINTKLKKILRTVIISSEDNFNNIIYLNTLNNRIIAATGFKVLSLARQEKRVAYDIRCIMSDNKSIYIATKEGRILSLTPDLDVVHKVKLPFAHILGMIEDDDSIYLLEKEEYIIKVDKKTFEYQVYETDFSDGLAFVGKNAFYVDDTKITIKK
ncbi:MAG: hypothetical protein FAF05_06955 [Epsilonproteobacteria bacterium]|nr:hypothetical protein [Campylobacterota bacterium]